MKRILTILALSLMCITSNAQLVWKISGNGIKKPSYILGTHHGCPFTYCDSIPGLMKAFDKVDNIIGEINMIELAEMSPERMQKMQAMMMMPADTSLLSLFSTEEAAKVNEWLGKKMGASLEMLSVMKPMTIMVTVQNKEMMEVIPEIATMTRSTSICRRSVSGRAKQSENLRLQTIRWNSCTETLLRNRQMHFWK